jgi:hypothetical protein
MNKFKHKYSQEFLDQLAKDLGFEWSKVEFNLLDKEDMPICPLGPPSGALFYVDYELNQDKMGEENSKTNNIDKLILELDKEKARHLLNCLIYPDPKGKDLDVQLEIEDILTNYLNKSNPKTNLSEEEIKQVKLFIDTLGYYQCFEPVKNHFKWDDETTKNNLTFVLNQHKDGYKE